MSSGSQIGGAVGAVVGGVIGFYTGNWQAVQWGYAIGSAVGGYVDPTRTYGPRLEDASAQTSTVGGVIPFGYGVFTCSGNIIWTDRLIEHKKTERVGKGGSQKNTTYTYTRSYAIGVCEGPIAGYVWIKKNGKLVYAAEPAALGAAMGWDGQQIADLVASSEKFLQMATLYYGTDSQMPDSTIVAVEGVGNVSPFRDLAYIVLENEDLTDMRGAVSQYEFCVRGSLPDVFLTSKPYQIVDQDSLASSSQPMWMNNARQPFISENVEAGSDLEFAELLVVVRYLAYDLPPEDEMACDSDFESGELLRVVNYLTYSLPPDQVEADGDFMGGELEVVAHYLTYANWPEESVVASGGFESGSLTEV